MWFWRFSFTMNDTRHDIFRNNRVADKVENDDIEEEQMCFVKRDKSTPLVHTIGAAEVIHPFEKHDTMYKALRALGWEGQQISWWHNVPPHVQDDWEDMDEIELLDSPMNHSPAPMIRVMTEYEIRAKAADIRRCEEEEEAWWNENNTPKYDARG